MEIDLAERQDLPAVRKYDRHIPSSRLGECISRSQVSVLRDGSQVFGVLRCSLFWQTIPFLDLIYIDEAYRGKGYGRKMMAHWESRMADMGFRYCMLSTQEDESAKFFYEKLGYCSIGAFLPPEQTADEIIYLKELAP